MQLQYYIRRGFNPDLFEKLSGLRRDETVLTAGLCLTTKASQQSVSSRTLAELFGALLDSLAEQRPIQLVFSHDVRQAEQKLEVLNLSSRKDRGSIRIEVALPHLPKLSRILEAGAFTTFYGYVDAGTTIPNESSVKETMPGALFKSLDKYYFVCVFSLYDESMELISKALSEELVINALQSVGALKGISISSVPAG